MNIKDVNVSPAKYCCSCSNAIDRFNDLFRCSVINKVVQYDWICNKFEYNENSTREKLRLNRIEEFVSNGTLRGFETAEFHFGVRH